MGSSKIVTIYVEKDILLRITNNKDEADYAIVSGNKEVICVKGQNEDITNYLLDNGISLNAGGFRYLYMAINLASKKIKENRKYTLTGDIYPLIAERYSVSTCSVDRAIWNALNRSKSEDKSTKTFIEKFMLGI